jgi:hypothetical protein
MLKKCPLLDFFVPRIDIPQGKFIGEFETETENIIWCELRAHEKSGGPKSHATVPLTFVCATVNYYYKSTR